MSLFSKPESQPQKPRERVVIPSRGGAGDGAISIVGPGMVIDGDVATEGIVRIEGVLKGTVRAAKAVIVGPAGRVEGHVVTDDAVIGGTVEGAIVGNKRVELQATSRVLGVIHARPSGLKLEEGARFNGKIEMLEDDQTKAAETEAQTVNALEALRGLRGPVDVATEEPEEQDDLKEASSAA